MNNICVKICDDDTLLRQRLKEMILTSMEKHGYSCVCRCYATGQEFWKDVDIKEDLIFLDIDLPDTSGFEIAEKLAKQKKNRKIVFVTEYDNYVFPSLEYYPFYYLRKSQLSEEKVEAVIGQYFERKKEDEKILQISVKNETHTIPMKDILMITHWQHQMSVRLADGTEKIFRSSIKEWEAQLEGPWFFKANRGTIVNLKYYGRFDGICLWHDDKESVTVARGQRKEVKERLLEIWRDK